MYDLQFTFKGPGNTRDIVFFSWFSCRFSEILKKVIAFLELNIRRKLRTTVIDSSQWNMFVVSIFWAIWGKQMQVQKPLKGVVNKLHFHTWYLITLHVTYSLKVEFTQCNRFLLFLLLSCVINKVHWIRGHWIQDFFSTLVTKYFSILKHFSRFWIFFLDFDFFSQFHKYFFFFWLWNIFLDSKIFFSILKAFSCFWKFFLDGGYRPP